MAAACISLGIALCGAERNCAAFGIHGLELQFHSCAITIPNDDWTIYTMNGSTFAPLPGHVNVDNSKCAGPEPHATVHCGGPSPKPPAPTPPPPTHPYTVQGAIDVGTLENSIFSWKGVLYLLENVNEGYHDSAGKYFPAFKGHSYARVRRLMDGVVLVNITSTIGYGFISAFPDYKHDRVWLFGTNHDRGGKGPEGGYRCTASQAVTAWWTLSGDDLTMWDTACTDATSADNVVVSYVASPPSTLPQHAYVMSNECPGWALSNGTAEGNLTTGWLESPAGTGKGPCGGPSVRWAPEPGHASRGYYYRITGGHTVELARSRDLQDPWQSVMMISPTNADANVSKFAGFPAVASELGWDLNHQYPRSWDFNSNDADVCCMDPSVKEGYVVWGASTQGGAPRPPVPRNQTCANVVGTSTMPLPEMLDAFFSTPLPPGRGYE